MPESFRSAITPEHRLIGEVKTPTIFSHCLVVREELKQILQLPCYRWCRPDQISVWPCPPSDLTSSCSCANSLCLCPNKKSKSSLWGHLVVALDTSLYHMSTLLSPAYLFYLLARFPSLFPGSRLPDNSPLCRHHTQVDSSRYNSTWSVGAQRMFIVGISGIKEDSYLKPRIFKSIPDFSLHWSFGFLFFQWRV